MRPRFQCNEDNALTPACGGNRPFTTEKQNYDSNQLNSDKGGLGSKSRHNFHMPDFTYYYTIPELEFELVAMDYTVLGAFPDIIGGTGFEAGATKVKAHCRSEREVGRHLQSVYLASTRLLAQRAQASERKNVAIIGHYPDLWQGGYNLRDMYLKLQQAYGHNASTIFNFYGHTHSQYCDSTDGKQCVNFLTGGGGGCCGGDDSAAGFIAISWNDATKDQEVECFRDNEAVHGGGQGSWRRCTLARKDLDLSAGAAEAAWGEESCAFTADNPRCPNFHLPSQKKTPISQSSSTVVTTAPDVHVSTTEASRTTMPNRQDVKAGTTTATRDTAATFTTTTVVALAGGQSASTPLSKQGFFRNPIQSLLVMALLSVMTLVAVGGLCLLWVRRAAATL
ncbi:unnamed protein product [Polarella glacialis]|uniref:Calcineurin-like phosphoesterase domain-containing protein n=1 Tax=Polarella glacialis TaxID=89957 RepID=A0A813F8S0_POLGL|nr:unnamed protein product [Polarella glacialis]